MATCVSKSGHRSSQHAPREASPRLRSLRKRLAVTAHAEGYEVDGVERRSTVCEPLDVVNLKLVGRPALSAAIAVAAAHDFAHPLEGGAPTNSASGTVGGHDPGRFGSFTGGCADGIFFTGLGFGIGFAPSDTFASPPLTRPSAASVAARSSSSGVVPPRSPRGCRATPH